MLKLHLTCCECPEQYDVYDEAGEQVGYLRLRHGSFTAKHKGVNGRLVYEASPLGDGRFEDTERVRFLNAACRAIERAILEEAQPIYELIDKAPNQDAPA
jgi:hypothetical protein